MAIGTPEYKTATTATQTGVEEVEFQMMADYFPFLLEDIKPHKKVLRPEATFALEVMGVLI